MFKALFGKEKIAAQRQDKLLAIAAGYARELAEFGVPIAKEQRLAISSAHFYLTNPRVPGDYKFRQFQLLQMFRALDIIWLDYFTGLPTSESILPKEKAVELRSKLEKVGSVNANRPMEEDINDLISVGKIMYALYLKSEPFARSRNRSQGYREVLASMLRVRKREDSVGAYVRGYMVINTAFLLRRPKYPQPVEYTTKRSQKSEGKEAKVEESQEPANIINLPAQPDSQKAANQA